MAIAHCRCINGHDFTAPCVEAPDVNATVVDQNCSVCDSDEFDILNVTYPEYPEDDNDQHYT